MENPNPDCDCYEQGLQFICCEEVEEPAPNAPRLWVGVDPGLRDMDQFNAWLKGQDHQERSTREEQTPTRYRNRITGEIIS